MTMPDKDKVVSASAQNTGSGSGPHASSTPQGGPQPKTTSRQAAGSQESTADGKPSHDTTATPQDAQTASAQGVAEVIEAEVLDPENAEGETPASDSELVAQAQAETAEWRDKYVRLHAEWDTYRRRTSEQRAEEKARATEKLVESLLPVLDDFERTIEYAQKNGENGLLSGVEAVQTKFLDALIKDGVEVLNPKGEAFDALEAQAVSTVEDASVPDETVADVYQKGYKMGIKVLRPAMVTVSTGGPKREVPAED